MGISRDSRTILRFAGGGFGAVGLALVCLLTYQLTESTVRNWLVVVAVCFCPALLLIARDFYIAEQLTRGGWALVLLLVAVTNCLLYSLIGIIYVLLRKRFDTGKNSQKATT